MKRTTRRIRRTPAAPSEQLPAPIVEPERHRVSWVDRLTEAVDRSPLPPWLVYPLIFAVLLSVLVALAGPLVTEYFPIYFLAAVWAVFPLALMHHLDRVSARALDQFRPVCDLNDVEAGRLRLELTTMPAAPTAVASLAGAAFIWFFYLTNRGLFDPILGSPLQFVVGMGVNTFCFALLAVLLYHTVRQLRMVSRIYARLQRLDLFNLSPLYGFAALTARTSIAWAVALYFSLALNPSLLESGVAMGAVLLQASLVLGTFAWPLFGIHRRIVQEKERATVRVGESLQRAIAELNRRSASMDLAEMDALNKMILSLIASREVLGKVPTWPWSPGTPAAVGTALLLPVALFVIERLLAGAFGL
jgi:hypothetical protein